MNYYNYILTFLGICTFLSCGENPCTECVDSNGTIEVTNSKELDWLYAGPNVFNSFEQSISVYLGGDFNGTPSLLTEIVSYHVTISKGDNILIEQSELNQLSGNMQSGYNIRIPVANVSEAISKRSELLDLVISATSDTEQTFNLNGKIQYLNCESIDFDEFDATDCRWSCQQRTSPLSDGCIFCF